MQRAKLELDFNDEDRYARFRLISWWDQELLRKARVMVVGAGAIGNEVIKNLALLGVGTLYIVDMDRIEFSNLSRSVLFRREDEGRYKAVAAAEQAIALNPDVEAYAIVGSVVDDVGAGLFRHVDLVIGGLDNREARVAINQKCWLTNTPWIDGAIEVLHGVARVFVPPDGSCYECTMTEQDYRLLDRRRSCALLSKQEMLQGKVPTTPTTAAVIAGIQVQEAIKILHKSPHLPVLAGRGFIFNGLTHDSYVVEYPVRAGCLAHETMDELVVLDDVSSGETTLAQLLEKVRSFCGTDAVLELNHELVVNLYCEECKTVTDCCRVLHKVQEKEGLCPRCGTMRIPTLTHRLMGGEPCLEETLAGAGLPLWDIVCGRRGMEQTYFELAGDRPCVTHCAASPRLAREVEDY